MPDAARFLYGLALGISLGIIASKLAAATWPGTSRRPKWNGRFRALTRVPAKEEERQEAATR